MKSLKGHLLVATPQLLDPNFSRTVLLMLEHSPTGALGLILNRPTEATVADIAEQVLDEPSDWDKAIGLGGPVPGPLLVLHGESDLADQEILAGVFSTADADKVRQLLRRRADPALIVANYAGWGPEQLEGEIAADSWVFLPARPEHVFGTAADALWATALREARAGTLAGLLGLRHVPADPSLN